MILLLDFVEEFAIAKMELPLTRAKVLFDLKFSHYSFV